MKFFDKDEKVAYVIAYFWNGSWFIQKTNKIFDKIGESEIAHSVEEKDARVLELRQKYGL